MKFARNGIIATAVRQSGAVGGTWLTVEGDWLASMGGKDEGVRGEGQITVTSHRFICRSGGLLLLPSRLIRYHGLKRWLS
jgi:hypothetical protein